MPDLIELALNSHPSNPALQGPLPSPIVVAHEGISYSGFTYQRRKGGIAGSGATDYVTGEYSYTVESSTDLRTWAAAGTALIQVSATPNADGVTETVVLRTTTPLDPVFFRLAIGRR